MKVPNYSTELYKDHLIIAPKTGIFNNDALDELSELVQMLGKGKTSV